MYEVEATGNVFLAFAQGQREAATASARQAAPDASLVAAVRRGDHEAFGRLYSQYAPMVHGILLARVPYDEVDDLLQDVFLAAFKKLHTLREDGAFGGWLAMITRNRAMDFYRQSQPSEELTEDIPQPSAPETEAAEVLGVIRSLPEAYRETLVLRLVEGMTGPEIAAQTGLTPDSVRVNLHRGMKLLREKLQGKESTA